MLLQASRRYEVHRDMAMLIWEMENCHLRTRESSVGQTGENTKQIRNFGNIGRICKKKIVTLNWMPQICNEPHGLGASFKSAYYPFRVPTVPNVRDVSRRGKLRNSLANCVQYMCCVLVKVGNRELRNVVVEKHMYNSSLWQHKPNPAFTFHCTCVSGTPLTWPQQHNWLRRPGGLWEGQVQLVCMQTAVDLANKHKKNNTESIQTVSDEVKRKECEFYKITCLWMGLEDKFLKWSFIGQQNPTLIVGLEGKMENMKLFPAVRYLITWAVTARSPRGKGQSAPSPSSFRWFSGDFHRQIAT